MESDLFVTYHTFGLVDGDRDWPADLPSPTNGLIHPYPGGALLYTGIHTGQVHVQVRTSPAPPAQLDDSRDWESIAEVSVDSPQGRLAVRSFENLPDLPVLSINGRGTYRVRAYALGRDTDIDGTATTPFEYYLIEVWPAPAAEATSYRSVDRYGDEVLHSMQAAANVSSTTDEPDGVTFEEWV
ncbi:hypothetical protein EV385_3103 [Krasilnikovia cinnamomea]|uniref:Uncharacterized protein n=1 Tax=Krasilnikovia cinnamomea TaxID=349313 RepID=A0A4Q7ZK48_9ACTN|nr:hypothetical protein [Krasilnikovia cinnamomea]RZU51292.1 hypothetical protein EV385_3103 [Krasilnikovia cinnamomea]